jgi:integrase/recombinase XerD
MLNGFIDDFQNYCIHLSLSENSIKELIRYIRHLDEYLKNNNIKELSQLNYKQLFNFAVSGTAGPATVKARIWAMKKFFCFLLLHNHIHLNYAEELKPPKIPKKESSFLTENEMKIVFDFLARNINTAYGLRNLVIILLLALCGLRKSSAVKLDLADIDGKNHTMAISEKGLAGKRIIPLPSGLSLLISEYIHRFEITEGALFLNRRKKRMNPDAVNKIVNQLKEELLKAGHDFAAMLHPHIFRHSAATQLNEYAGFTITKETLGHRSSQNTRKYIHLAPTSYGAYMKRHPYFR